MREFTKDEIMLLCSVLETGTGTSISLRDKAQLCDMIDNVFCRLGNSALYPTELEQGVRLGYEIVLSDLFGTGSKCVGAYVMLTFLELNGIPIGCTDEELVEVINGITGHKYDYLYLIQWATTHKLPT